VPQVSGVGHLQTTNFNHSQTVTKTYYNNNLKN
jgi:hypothetical protein